MNRAVMVSLLVTVFIWFTAQSCRPTFKFRSFWCTVGYLNVLKCYVKELVQALMFWFFKILISLSNIIDTVIGTVSLNRFGWIFPLTDLPTSRLNRVLLRHGINAEVYTQKTSTFSFVYKWHEFGECHRVIDWTFLTVGDTFPSTYSSHNLQRNRCCNNIVTYIWIS